MGHIKTQKKGVASIHETEAKYRTLFNAIDQGFVIVEVIFDKNQHAIDYRFLEGNPAFIKQTKLDHAMGRSMKELAPGHEDFWFDVYGEIAKTGQPKRFEHFASQIAGGVWFEVYAFKFGVKEENLVAILFNDITERKRYEEQQDYLRKLTENLRDLDDSSSIQQTACELAIEHFQTDRAYYCEIDQGQAIIHKDSFRGNLSSVVGTYPLASFPIFQKIINEGTAVVVSDAYNTDVLDDSLRAICIQLNVISFIDVPVIKNSAAVGIFCLLQSTPRNWTTADVQVLTDTVERIWFAIDRARAEEALRATKEKYRRYLEHLVEERTAELQAILDSSLYVMQAFKAVRNRKGKIIDFTWMFVNKKWKELYGDEMKGKSLLTENPGVTETGLFDKFVHVTETGIPAEFDHYYAHEQFDAWFHQTHVKLGDGFLLTAIDISKEKKAQEQLLHLKDEIAKHATDRYQTLFNSIDDGFQIIELVYDESSKPVDFRFIEINHSHERQTGLKNVAGKLASELGVSIDESWYRIFQQVLNTGKPLRHEGYNEGRYYSAYVFRPSTDDRPRVAALFSDITERKRHEASLAILAKVSESLAKSTDIGETLEMLCEKICTHFNAGFVSFSRVDENAGTVTITQSWHRSDSMSPSGVLFINDYHDEEVQELMRSGRPEIVSDTEQFRAEMAMRYRELGIGAYVNTPFVRKNQWHFTMTVASKTPRKWDADEIELMCELTARIWTRMEREKADIDLRESEVQLRKLLRQRDEFIGIASHELKTPITSIKAYAEIIQERVEEIGYHTGSDMVMRLTSQIDRLTALINMLLDTTRIAEGQLLLTYESFDITEIVQERISEISHTSNHVFDVQIENPIIVTADKERIGQVITNLLSNAIKYSPQKSQVTVILSSKVDNVSVQVIDQGCGISEENKKNVFSRYYRIAPDNARTLPGIGLGLYISAEIVRRHHGTISVASEAGKGATFTFTIPCNAK